MTRRIFASRLFLLLYGNFGRGRLARSFPFCDLNFHTGNARFKVSVQPVRAAEVRDLLRGLVFRAGHITQDLCHEDLDVHPIRIPGRQPFGDFKRLAMLLL
jgi:hypothetical protein